MEHTEVLQDENAPEFTSEPGNPRAVNLAWARDGRGAPGPGTGGILLPVRESTVSRQLLARTADGRRFLVELPLDRLDPESFPEAWADVDNRTLEEIWRNRTIAAASMEGDAGGPPVSLGYEEYPPLLICREKGAVFHPPWPGAGAEGPIEVCRDDGALSRAGLPGFETSGERFLFNPVAARSTSQLKLYTAESERPPLGTADVGTCEDFMRDLGSRLPAGGAPPTSRFPCVGCDQAPQCFPSAGGAPGRPGLAEQRLRPVAFYPFRAIARPMDVASFAEHADILGGATWNGFRRRHVQQWQEPGLALARESLERTVFADVPPTDPLRAVAAKLGLFESVVDEVRRYHRMFGQPHLGLSPQTVVTTSLQARADGTYPTQLLGQLLSPMLRDDRTPPPGAPLWLPPPGAAAPYAPDDLVAVSRPRRKAREAVAAGGFGFGLPIPVRATVGRLWDDAARGTCEYELTLASDAIGDGVLAPDDLVKIEVTLPGWERTLLWCRLDTERPSSPGHLQLRGFPVALGSAQRLDMQQAQGQGALFGSATVHRGYGAWYDIHALGMLLLQLLVDNADQRVADVASNALPPLTTLASAPAVAGSSRGWQKLVEGAAHAVRTPPLDAFLSDRNACFFGSEAVEADRRVPAQIWGELIATVVACVTNGSSIAFCRTTRIERDRDAFCAPVERLLERLRELRAALPNPRTDQVLAAAPPTRPPVPMGAPAAMELPTRDVDMAREVKRLEEALAAQAAQIKRLESERDAVKHARAEAQRPAANPAGDAAIHAWNDILTALAGTPDHGQAPPRPGDPAFELVKSIAVDGLETISALLTAVAELGGQEFANEQQNLRRVIRRVLAQGAPRDEAGARRFDAAAAQLRRSRLTLGGVIAALVEAHGRSTREGSRQLLTTLEVGMRRELKLSKGDTAKLVALMERMKGNLGELIARLYDPAFHRQVRKHVQRGME